MQSYLTYYWEMAIACKQVQLYLNSVFRICKAKTMNLSSRREETASNY